MTYTKTTLANRALDIVGKATITDYDTGAGATADCVRRNYEVVLKRCLRKAEPSFAIVREELTNTGSDPVNEFDFEFAEPAAMVKLLRVWATDDISTNTSFKFKRESGKILTDEESITIKYISSACFATPSLIADDTFAEYFAHELAVAMAYKLTDSVTLRAEIKKEAFARFEETTAINSQEDTNDDPVESPWVTARDSLIDFGTITIDGLG